LKSNKTGDLSLYIHIPFCKSTCLYCAFPRFASQTAKIQPYIECLHSEIRANSSKYDSIPVKSIYFGGGTPSYIEPRHIKNILQTVTQSFRIAPEAEITIESNPESLTETNLSEYLQAGINRFSMGAQSLNEKTLRKIGRPHGSMEIFEALALFKKMNTENFGLDFIIGLPYQTPESFKKEVDTILKHAPAHLSYYFLSYDTNKIDLFIKDCPSEKDQIKMYNYLIKTLKSAGYIHYEISNYSKPGFECRHNLRYWQQKEYVGFGLGAHSYFNNQVWSNTENLSRYLSGTDIIDETIELDADLQKMDYIMLALRTLNGISKNEYSRKYQDFETLKLKIAEFSQQKMVNIDKKGISLTEKGYLLGDFIIKKCLS